MTWTKLSDTFAEEMDAASLDPEAFTLHVAALCYCNRLLTDGKIPVRKVKTMYSLEDPDAAAKALVAAGLWELSKDGQHYLIVNFLTDQRPAEKVRREREAGRVRQQNWLDRRRGHAKPAEETPTNGNRSPAKKATASKPRTTKKTAAKKATASKRTNGVSNGVSNAYPAPPRPEGRRGRGGGASAAGSPGGSPTYAPPPVKNPRPLEPAFTIAGVPFVVDLISQWTGGHERYRTWIVVRVPEGTHQPYAAVNLFSRLNKEVANGERSQYATTNEKAWSYCMPDGDHFLEQNGPVLKQWIEQHPALDGIRAEAFEVWTAAHASNLRGPQPKGTAA